MTAGRHPRAIHVVAGVLIDRRRRVLIAQRPAGKHMAGAWEFPGGKLEPGEAPAEGLGRELGEEIGIVVRHPRPLMRLRHEYSHGEVLLDIWVVRRWQGEPRSLDGQALRWCGRSDLRDADLLPADRAIIAALTLPDRLRRRGAVPYRVRDFGASLEPRGRTAAGRRLEGVLCRGLDEADRAAALGADFLAMRTELSARGLAQLCARVAIPIYARGLSLERAWALGASGVNALKRS